MNILHINSFAAGGYDMKFKSVMVTKRGGPEVLQIVENELRPAAPNEVLVKILACGVGHTDVDMRYFKYPGSPKIPFVPGYEMVGIVETVGNRVTRVQVGDVVAALTVYGGYSEYIYLQEENIVKVPKSLDAGEVAAVILNYTAAYQMIKRVAHVKTGDRILIIGASGGVGSALLDLGKMEKLIMYGTAAAEKHEKLRTFGAVLIDYKKQNFVEVLRDKEPDGIDYVFDGVGGPFIKEACKTLRPGGLLVNYSFNMKSFSGFFKSIIDMVSGSKHGKKAKGYGISANYQMDRKSVLEDISTVLDLLEKGKIKPLISKRMSIFEAGAANRMLENGEVTGKIVLTLPT
jgi:NADPH:quinone reductase-like Zn-dependent oxidoreductase